MTPKYTAKIAAALVAGLLTQPTLAGENPVDPFSTVFIPPVVFSPTPKLGIALSPATGTAPAPASGAPAAPATEAEAAEAIAASEDAQAARATRAFTDAQFLCSRLAEAEYKVDCLSDQLSQYAASLPQSADFDVARNVVESAAVQLNQVARRNASTTKRPGRLREASGAAPRASSRAIVPVATERLETAFSLASEILRESETQLLRAAEQSERRRVAFTEVASAVGGSALLLRSA